MAVFVTGDTHSGAHIDGVYEWDERVGQGLSRDDLLVVAGDFGYPWDFSQAEEDEVYWLETRPYRVVFVDGNHENYDHWRSRPVKTWRGGRTQQIEDYSPIRRLCRGEVFTLGGSRVFTFGGAASVDRQWRTEGLDWWPDELPGEEEFAHARATLDACGWEVDYVITHTCASRLLGKTLYPKEGWEHPARDRLTDFLDEVEERLSYRHWYFGHFHEDKDVDERHTLLFNEVVPLGAGVFG